MVYRRRFDGIRSVVAYDLLVDKPVAVRAIEYVRASPSDRKVAGSIRALSVVRFDREAFVAFEYISISKLYYRHWIDYGPYLHGAYNNSSAL